VTSVDELLLQAKSALQEGRREAAAKLLDEAASVFASQEVNDKAAILYERAALIYREVYLAYESFKAFENATLMLIRQPNSLELQKKIVDLNTQAGKTAEETTDYKRAADFYFRASDFVVEDEAKSQLTLKAADALESLADTREQEEDLESAVSLLKKVGRLYYTCGDAELGKRINDRAAKVAQRWAQKAKREGELLSAGNALAEAAQIMQTEGESPEAARLMMEAGELYEAVSLFEKAGNIYDAAQESYQMLRQTSGRRTAITKAAEAYLKMEGKPEVLAPLLIKAGNLFLEIGLDVKAKWAFKRGNELFGVLAEKAGENKEIDSQMQHHRYQALCLMNWGRTEEADALYTDVIDYYLGQAELERDNKEAYGLALEAASDVLEEAQRTEEAKAHLERALEMYVELAEEFAASDTLDESSRLYSKAADCAKKLGDDEKSISYYEIASVKAEEAANSFMEMDVKELATIWLRTAGMEALKTGKEELLDKAIGLLRDSADGFKSIDEMSDAFEDLFAVFEALFLHRSDSREEIVKVLDEMDELARTAQEYKMHSLMTVINSLEKGNPTAALLALQEREEELLPLRERLLTLVKQSKLVRAPEDFETTGRTHWLYK
jgi:tetratricopeptide (TPR) repeat protein